MSRARRWVFTINNFTPQDEERLQALQPKYLVYGRETGESGTPHLQGFVIFEVSLRFNSVKTQIGQNAHIETARGTTAQASQYCKKDGDYFEYGDMGQQGSRSDWDQYIEWVQAQETRISQRDIIRAFPRLWARYHQRLIEIAEAHSPVPQLVVGQPRDGWQRELVDLVGNEPHERGIHFYVDPDGNSGKSWICAYLLQTMPEKTQILKTGKEADMCYAVDESKSIFLLDVPRSRMEFLQYSVLEQLKDRMVFSTKYNSQMKILPLPTHVIVMCNEQPDMNKLSVDRYIINNI